MKKYTKEHVKGLKKTNNKIVIVRTNGEKIEVKYLKNVHIEFRGDNNYIEIHEPFYFKMDKSVFILSENNKIIIDSGLFVGISMHIQDYSYIYPIQPNAKLSIGKNFYCMGLTLTPSENADIIIGDNCMFSRDIEIRSSDGHPIYEKGKEVPLLKDNNRPVIFGNHIWCAKGSTILKGATIPDNCVIGACSLVTKKEFKENCVIAGNPAKIVKENIEWYGDNLKDNPYFN
jgi:acetyltransferase-like isoleucine patch superfamily enzyme